MSDTYKCAACGETFPKGWSDEEAQAEKERDFPSVPDDACDVVCDDCYKRMQARCAAEGYEWTDPELVREEPRP